MTTILDKYSIDKVIGTGMSGIVFHATSQSSKENVAVKIQCLEIGKQERKIHMAITSLIASTTSLANFITLRDYQIIGEDALLPYLPSTTWDDLDAKRILLECGEGAELLVLVMDLIDVELYTFINKNIASSYGFNMLLPSHILFEVYYGILSLLSFNITPRDIHIENIAFTTLSTSLSYKVCNRIITLPAGYPHTQLIDYGLYAKSKDQSSIDHIPHGLIMQILSALFQQLNAMLEQDKESMRAVNFFQDDDIFNEPALIILKEYADMFLPESFIDINAAVVSIKGTEKICSQMSVE